MNEDLKYKFSTADWRAQISLNQKRTRWVIAMFLIIYIAIGFLIDILLYSTWYHQLPLATIAKALVTFTVTPYATITMAIVAAVSLLITYSFHDKIMLLGTDSRQITPENAKNLQEQQLYNVIEEMKVAAGLQYMPKVYIIEANYMNAFASGYSEKSAMVAITRGLMEKLDRSELQAVMAHELSHIRHKDIKLTLTASVLSNIMLIAVDLIFYNLLFSRRDRVDGRILIFVIILRYALPMITVMLMMYLSRTREYMADAGCVELMRDNQPLARALLKIHQDHQGNRDLYAKEYGSTAHEDVRRAAYLYDPVKTGIEPIKSISSMFSTHPGMDARLKAIGVTMGNQKEK